MLSVVIWNKQLPVVEVVSEGDGGADRKWDSRDEGHDAV